MTGTDIAIQTHHSLRLARVVGDAMEPELRHGDYVLVTPCTKFDYDGTHMVAIGDGLAIFTVTYLFGRRAVKLTQANPACRTEHVLSLDEFAECVVARIVADVRIQDARALVEVSS